MAHRNHPEPQAASIGRIYTKSELRAMPTSQMKKVAFVKGVANVWNLHRSELEDLILAVQQSLQEAPKPVKMPQTPAPRRSQSPESSMRPSAPPMPRDQDTSTSRPTTSTAGRGLAECSICRDPMGGNAAKPMACVAMCGHSACLECLERIAEQPRSRCPRCRKDFKASEIRRIYV